MRKILQDSWSALEITLGNPIWNGGEDTGTEVTTAFPALIICYTHLLMHSQGVDSIDIQRKKKIPYCHPKHVDRSLEISIAVKEQKEEVLKTMHVSVEEIYGIAMD